MRNESNGLSATDFPGIKERRIQKGLTQQDLAYHMKVSISTIQRWDKSLSDTTISRIGILADILDCSIDDLLGMTDKQTEV